MQTSIHTMSVKEEIIVNVAKEFVWYAWTIPERVSEWFAPEAVIEAKEGGAYELYFIPGNKSGMNTKACKILNLTPGEELQFTWKGPDQFNDIMNADDQLTTVRVNFESLSEDSTNVTVHHTGFGKDEKWQEALEWHLRAWTGVLSSLKSALEKGEGNLCCQP
ncbi:SRPBCC domain-containing protein [Bacillus tianshenii]|uniref:SRPBCC family protein n=1 Tax=Sutcliffiella tianshenii TaxID=1463404 RepID=UPI001CD631B4|nr:SRPBCC domain-containing protein [Bacillus tianshenii]MCA1321467.1 SRPBCC domain-containing protein [Bacillus tianshenii]